MRHSSNSHDGGLVYDEPSAPDYAPPLFRPAAPVPAPQRGVGRAIAAAVALTLLIVGLTGVFFFAYLTQASELSDVKRERDLVAAERAELRTNLAISQDELSDTAGRLTRANVKLTNATKSLAAAKENLTKMRGDLVAAGARADANYSAGYSAGTSTGYDSGREAGLVQGSDELACSDDPDVYWLPACNY